MVEWITLCSCRQGETSKSKWGQLSIPVTVKGHFAATCNYQRHAVSCVAMKNVMLHCTPLARLWISSLSLGKFKNRWVSGQLSKKTEITLTYKTSVVDCKQSWAWHSDDMRQLWCLSVCEIVLWCISQCSPAAHQRLLTNLQYQIVSLVVQQQLTTRKHSCQD